MNIVIQGLAIGAVATVVMDAWGVVLKKLRLPAANWVMVGRWIGHFRHGRFSHDAIAAASPLSGEAALGWVAHYVIGLLYGVGYLLVLDNMNIPSTDLASALAFSMILLVMPWLVLQPGLGLGVFASRAPAPWLVRGVNVSVHLVFGFGLYAGTLMI